MSLTYPLRRMRGISVMFRNCLFTDEPIILCEGDEPKLVVMDSRVFARAYSKQLFFTFKYSFESTILLPSRAKCKKIAHKKRL